MSATNRWLPAVFCAKVQAVVWTIGLVVLPHHTQGQTSWTYHSDLAQVRPVARSIALAIERPEDLLEEPRYQGSSQRYAQLRYGSDNSRRVILVVDRLDSNHFDLYADLNRDRAIDASERIDGSGRSRQFPLDAEIIHEDTITHFARTIEVRLGFTGDRVSVATLGGITGSVLVPAGDSTNRTAIRVERIDGDANGLFADTRDRLRIDLDGNDQIDAVTEQFAWLPVQTFAGTRYAVKADREGKTLELQEITGTGTMEVTVASLPPNAKIVEVEAMVFSDDGSAWSLKEANQPQEVPVGRYTLGSVTLTIDTGDGDPWHYVFSRSNNIDDHHWLAVNDDGHLTLEAVGTPSFQVHNAPTEAAAGENLRIEPRLYTEAGLLVNMSCRGKQIGSLDNPRTHNTCQIRLLHSSGRPLSTTSSGFA